MRRSLSLAFFLRLMLLMVVLAGLRAGLPRYGWAVPVGVVLLLGGIAAVLLGRTVRQSVEPLFLPRPLLLVPALPRDRLGKLQQRSLAALRLATARGE